MLEEYQQQSQQVQDLLQQALDILEPLRQTLFDNYPEEDRTFRMHRAMEGLGSARQLMVQAQGVLEQIEWPTEERPR